jgi:hypothetical protein
VRKHNTGNVLIDAVGTTSPMHLLINSLTESASSSMLFGSWGERGAVMIEETKLDLTLVCSFEMCREKDSVPSSHTPKYLHEVTISSSEVVITAVGRGAFFLPNHVTFVLEVFRARLRVEEASWTLRKLCCRAFNTTYGEGPAEYKTVSSAYKQLRELPTA